MIQIYKIKKKRRKKMRNIVLKREGDNHMDYCSNILNEIDLLFQVIKVTVTFILRK